MLVIEKWRFKEIWDVAEGRGSRLALVLEHWAGEGSSLWSQSDKLTEWASNWIPMQCWSVWSNTKPGSSKESDFIFIFKGYKLFWKCGVGIEKENSPTWQSGLCGAGDYKQLSFESPRGNHIFLLFPVTGPGSPHSLVSISWVMLLLSAPSFTSHATPKFKTLLSLNIRFLGRDECGSLPWTIQVLWSGPKGWSGTWWDLLVPSALSESCSFVCSHGILTPTKL